MLIPSGSCLALYRFVISGDSEEMVITCGHDPDVDTPVNLANELFDAFGDTMFTAYAGAQVSFVGVDVQIGTTSSGEGPYISATSTLPMINSVSASALVPQNTAALITKVTDAPGRRGRGRMYMPGTVTEASVDSVGFLTAAAVTGRQTALNNWHARLLADSHDPLLLHATTPVLPTPITSFVQQALVATQRRRLRR